MNAIPWTPAAPLPRAARFAAWAAQLAMAAILAQTLFFKLTYAPETRFIFARLGGRPAATAAACVELLSAILLLAPRTSAAGALVALGTMGGAILAHLFVIGIVIPDPATGRGDGGLLFGLALTVAILAVGVLAIRRAEWLPLVRGLAGRRTSS